MENMFELWGRATSYNVQKVAWVIAELGLTCPRIDAGGKFGRLDDPDYIALNPNKRVPTLIDGEQVLWESNSICRYLVDVYDTNLVLRCKSAQQRAQADMWMEWFQNNAYANSIALFHQYVKLPSSQRSEHKRMAALNGLTNALVIFDAALEGRQFIIGTRLTLGDIPTGAFLYRYFTLDVDRPPLPNLERYYGTLVKRPAFRDAVMVDYSDLYASD